MSTLKLIGFSLALALMLGLTNVSADGVKMFYGKAPSAEEMGRILFAKPSSGISTTKHKGVSFRSVNFGKPKDSSSTLSEQASADLKDTTIGLPIKFGFDSADILEESKPFLMEVGKMLQLSNFSDEKLVIEGHTDAGGSEVYNQYLSERRAKSVKDYLKETFNIDSNRLFVTGMGESQPLPDVNPFSRVNRRVQFRKADLARVD